MRPHETRGDDTRQHPRHAGRVKTVLDIFINRSCPRQGSAPGPIGKVGVQRKKGAMVRVPGIFSEDFVEKGLPTEMLVIHVANL